jgi:hypothetical protein
MAKRLAIPSDELKLKIVGAYDSMDVARVQRLSMNTDVPATDVYEIGNPQKAGTALDLPAITLTFSVFDVGIRAFSVLTGTNPSAYPAGGVDISELQEADAIIYVKDASVSDFVKCAHAKRLQVRDFAFNYTVDGESTEDYTLVGSEKRWFKKDVVVDRFTVGTTSFTLTQTPIALKNGNNGLSVILDGGYLTEVTGVPATNEYRIVGTTLTTGDSMVTKCIAVYQADPAGTNWTDVSDAVMPAAVRGKDVKIIIAVEDIPRVQSVTVNGNLNVQNVREMGNDFIVGYQRQVPTVDGTITVLDTDTELMDLFINGSINSGDTEFILGTECTASGVDLKIRILDPCDNTNTTVLKTVYIPNVTIAGDAFSSNVNQNAQQTFNWRSDTAQCVVYSGSY